MSKTSTPKDDLLSPDAAIALWRELRPDAPETPVALYRRAKRGGIPYHLDGAPPAGRVHYSAAELAGWLLGPRALLGLRFLRLAEDAERLDMETRPEPPCEQFSAGATLIGADGVVYVGDLDGAEQWLRERAGKAVTP